MRLSAWKEVISESRITDRRRARRDASRHSVRPPEGPVRRLASRVSQVKQEGGDGVGHNRAHRPHDLVAADLHPLNLQHVLELRSILHVHLKEYDGDVGGNVVVFALLRLLVVVFCLVARLAPVGDDVDLAFVAYLLNEPQRPLVEFYVLLPQLERAVHPRDERGGDDRPDEEQRDHYAVGALYLVGYERVDEHGRDQPEDKGGPPRSPAPGRERNGEG